MEYLGENLIHGIECNMEKFTYGQFVLSTPCRIPYINHFPRIKLTRFKRSIDIGLYQKETDTLIK
jgi:hypothetical protein